MNVDIIIQRTRNILRNLKNITGNVPALDQGQIQMMMTDIQRKKDRDQSLALLQNILLVLNLVNISFNLMKIIDTWMSSNSDMCLFVLLREKL